MISIKAIEDTINYIVANYKPQNNMFWINRNIYNYLFNIGIKTGGKVILFNGVKIKYDRFSPLENHLIEYYDDYEKNWLLKHILTNEERIIKSIIE